MCLMDKVTSCPIRGVAATYLLHFACGYVHKNEIFQHTWTEAEVVFLLRLPQHWIIYNKSIVFNPCFFFVFFSLLIHDLML